MKADSDEVVIRIADLFAEILKACKPILCLMLVLALLGGLYGAYKVIDDAKHPSVTEKDIQDAEKTLASAEKKVLSTQKSLDRLFDIEIPDAEKKIVRAEELVRRRQEYIDNSLYYAIDPFHCGVSRVTLFVDTDPEINPATPWMTVNPQASIVLAYTRSYPFDSEIQERIRTIMGTDADLTYIDELVSVTNISNQFVEIRVCHSDAEVARRVTDYLVGALYTRVTESVGEFSANVVGRYVGYEIDWSMNDDHNSSDDALLNAERALVSAQESLQQLQEDTQASREQAVEDAKKARDDAKTALQKLMEKYANTTAAPKNVVKKAVVYCVVGAVLGFFLGGGIAVMKRLFGGKLQDIGSVSSRYAFPLIGVLPVEKKRWFDQSIRKLEGEPLTDFESAGKAAAQSLSSLVGDRKVAFVSSLGRGGIEPFLPFSGERVPVCGDVITDAEAVKAAEAYDSFVLVEKRGSSRIDMVDSEVRNIQAWGKKVEGIILF